MNSERNISVIILIVILQYTAPRLFNLKKNNKSLKWLYLEENMFFYKEPVKNTVRYLPFFYF
jgi:hypothetical protein